MKKQSVLSKEYVEVLVSSKNDPTGQPVSFYFPLENTPPTTPHTGEWAPGGKVNGLWTARILVGVDAPLVLPIERYDVWVGLTDAPEVPLLYGGLLEIF